MTDQTSLAALLHECICEYHWPDLLTCGIDHADDAARLAAAGVTVAPQKPTPESRRIGNGPTLGPLTPKQVRILDNRHHRVGNTVRCACGYDIWAFCEVHRLIETIDAAALAQPAPDALRAAAQAVFDLWDDGDLDPGDGMYKACLDALAALRAALAESQP